MTFSVGIIMAIIVAKIGTNEEKERVLSIKIWEYKYEAYRVILKTAAGVQGYINNYSANWQTKVPKKARKEYDRQIKEQFKSEFGGEMDELRSIGKSTLLIQSKKTRKIILNFFNIYDKSMLKVIQTEDKFFDLVQFESVVSQLNIDLLDEMEKDLKIRVYEKRKKPQISWMKKSN